MKKNRMPFGWICLMSQVPCEFTQRRVWISRHYGDFAILCDHYHITSKEQHHEISSQGEGV